MVRVKNVLSIFAKNGQSNLVLVLESKGPYLLRALGPVQTLNFTCAESNENKKNLLFSLICIRFGTCKVRRLNRALGCLSELGGRIGPSTNETRQFCQTERAVNLVTSNSHHSRIEFLHLQTD